MKIIEYEDKYIEDVKDLMVGIEEYLSNIDNDKAIGLIMGTIPKYNEFDCLDYKCPKRGVIDELIATKKVRSKGVGQLLMNKMEEYFKSQGCEYI